MIPHPYVILAAFLAILGAYVGGNLHGHRAERVTWEAATERLKAEQAQTLADETAKAVLATQRMDELAREKDAEDEKRRIADAAGRDDFERRLREARRRAGRCSAPTPASVNPGESAGAAPERDDGPGSPDPGLALRDAALELQRYAVACHGWALQVGR